MRHACVPWPGRLAQLLNDPIFASGDQAAQSFAPPCGIAETDAEYEIHIDVPGLTGEDITVEFRDGQLTVAGERKNDERSHVNWLRGERRFGKFQRVFSLPRDVDSTRIDASCANGVLVVKAPKAIEAQSKRIEVK